MAVVTGPSYAPPGGIDYGGYYPPSPTTTPPPSTTGAPTSGFAYDLGMSLMGVPSLASQFAQMYLTDQEGAWQWAISTGQFRQRNPGFIEGYSKWQGGTVAEKVGSYSARKADWDAAARNFNYAPTETDYISWASQGYSGQDVTQHLQASTGGGAWEDTLRSYGFSEAQIQIWKNYRAGFGPDIDSIGSFGDYVINQSPDLRQLGHTTYATAWADFHNDPTGQTVTRAASESRSAAGRAADTSAADSAAAQAAAEARQEAERKARIERAATTIQAGYDPSIAGLFTAEELHNAAIWDAGGEWGDAKAARTLALASPVNQYFMHFYGRGVTRAEVDQYYASGATPDYVNQTLDSLGIQRAFPEALRTMFTPEEIKQYSDEQAGIHTPEGKRLKELIDAAQAFNPIYQQWQGRMATRQEIEAHLAAGDTPEKVRGVFGGQSWIQANLPDVQYYQGAFGEGPLTPEQQTALGQTQAGYANPLGQTLQFKFDKAVERARASFQGTLAHMERNTPFSGITQQLPDIAA